MLIEEVEKRSRVRGEHVKDWPKKGAVVLVGPAAGVRLLAADRGVTLPETGARRPGGFSDWECGRQGCAGRLGGGGINARGVLFGVGRLLRELRLDAIASRCRRTFRLPPRRVCRCAATNSATAPRPTPTTRWTVPMWEQYIRDLAVFGCNAIELIPPRSDDAADSPHFPLPPMQMMAEMSRLADDYGLDVWIWYPAMDRDYTDPATVEAALKEWAEVFRQLPRIDAVFVPGGDPGHTRRSVLMSLLEKQTANLRRIIPRRRCGSPPKASTPHGWKNSSRSCDRSPPG